MIKLTSRQAAERAGVDIRTIHAARKAGRIRATQEGVAPTVRYWYTQEAVDQYIAIKRKYPKRK